MVVKLKLIPWLYEDILPFEFEMKEFTKNRRNGDRWSSPPFYTDINGYKMHMKVETKGKYVSVHVAVFLMAGVADDYLKWPFQEDINLKSS